MKNDANGTRPRTRLCGLTFTFTYTCQKPTMQRHAASGPIRPRASVEEHIAGDGQERTGEAVSTCEAATNDRSLTPFGMTIYIFL
jgi:hypothetical protein